MWGRELPTVSLTQGHGRRQEAVTQPEGVIKALDKLPDPFCAMVVESGWFIQGRVIQILLLIVLVLVSLRLIPGGALWPRMEGSFHVAFGCARCGKWRRPVAAVTKAAGI